MEYAAIVTAGDDALIVEFPGLDGARTEVRSDENLDEMAGEALALWLESELQLRRVPPTPRRVRIPKRGKLRMVRIPAVLSARIQIRQARAAAGLTQSELARRIGVTQQQVANIESPDGDIRLGTLERAANALELTIDLRLRPRAARAYR